MALLLSLPGFGPARRHQEKFEEAPPLALDDTGEVADPLSRILGSAATAPEAREPSRDPLTGLLNRDAFTKLVELQVEIARRADIPITLVCLKPDLFEKASLASSYLAGVRLFREVSQRMQSCARDTDIIGRLDDEVFGVLLPGTELEAGLTAALRMKKRLEEPYAIGRGETVSVVFGVASFPDVGAGDAADLIRQARQAVSSAWQVRSTSAPRAFAIVREDRDQESGAVTGARLRSVDVLSLVPSLEDRRARPA